MACLQIRCFGLTALYVKTKIYFYRFNFVNKQIKQNFLVSFSRIDCSQYVEPKIFRKMFLVLGIKSQSNGHLPRGCIYWKKVVPLSGISHSPGSRKIWKIFLIFSLCLYDQMGWFAYRDLGSQRRDLDKRDKQNKHLYPYKHSSSPANVNFNRGVHAYDIRIQTIMPSVNPITRHHWTIE